jgi:hypothetical protein
MPAGNTYEAIATNTTTALAASVTFSSIPQTYTDLVLVCEGVSASGDAYPYLNFNGDTGANYSGTNLYGDGSTATSDRRSNSTRHDIVFWRSTGRNNLIANVMNYSNSTTFKTTLSRGNNAEYSTHSTVMLWRNTNAITSLTVYAQYVNFGVGSTFSLYGIKAA